MQIAGIPESGRIKKCHFLAWINTCSPSATVQHQTPPAACYFAAPRGMYNKALLTAATQAIIPLSRSVFQDKAGGTFVLLA